MHSSDWADPLPDIPHDSGRVSPRVAAILRVNLIDGRLSLPAKSTDIGLGGICVQTESIVDSTRITAVEFQLGSTDVRAAVLARWHSPAPSREGPLTGFSFEDLSPPAEVAIWNFVHERGRELASFLLGCEGLSNLSLYDALQIALTTRIREVHTGETIYDGNPENPCRSIFVVYRGSVAIEDANSSLPRTIALLGPHALFGGMPIIAGCAPFDRAVAADESTVLELVSYNVDYLTASKPQVAATLLRAVALHYMTRVSKLLQSLDDKRS